jgi:caffeoyl-CoA O-methyltransferase
MKRQGIYDRLLIPRADIEFSFFLDFLLPLPKKSVRMEFISEELDTYICKHTEKESALLSELNRKTHLEVLRPRMLSGHFQGRVLSLLSHMIRPLNVLEIGTYTGYSALCFAEGLQEEGKVITIDINEELEDFVKEFIAKSDYSTKVDLVIGNAMEVIPALKMKFDIVFIDADKQNYSNYYDCVFDKVRHGGYIIADNVLWSGKVLGGFDSEDIDTQHLQKFNKKIQEDSRVQNVLFPIRDGLMIARKL